MAEFVMKSEGMIQEVLGSMGSGGRITGPMDESAGGRVMSDTTCIFILDTWVARARASSSLFIVLSRIILTRMRWV